MADVRQSSGYAQFIKNLGWQVEKLGKWNVFIKKFPLIGSLIKIQRIQPPIPFEEIEKLAKKHRAFQIILESSLPHFSPSQLDTSTPLSAGPQLTTHPHTYHPLKSPFIPTKTLILDLLRPENEIFDSFTKNKRRDVRIAERNNLIIKEGTPEEFFFLKKRFLLGRKILPFGTKKEIFLLIKAFGPEKSKILIAYSPQSSHILQISLAGTLLLFHDKIAYYWQAAASNEGKKLLAPTLLLWEAIKIAKEKGSEIFDFEGIYDERFPQNKSWLGFTHFKQGFGGKEIEFPLPLSSLSFL